MKTQVDFINELAFLRGLCESEPMDDIIQMWKSMTLYLNDIIIVWTN